jgi:hypothetical protein
VHVEAVRDQCHTDQDQKGERQHLGGRMLSDEMRDRTGGSIHNDHGHHDGGNHDLDVLGHADGGDDRIQGKHQVDQR